MWRSFRNYFWSAQLIAGLALAFKVGMQEGVLGAALAWFLVMPLTALLAWARVAYEKRHPPPPVPPKIRWIRTVAIGVASAAIVIGAMIALAPLLKA